MHHIMHMCVKSATLLQVVGFYSVKKANAWLHPITG